MFTKLRIKNFKAWGDQLWRDGVELAPVTLLLGANSAGKTSLLQPLLLLRQTFGSPDRSLDLYLGGKKGDLLDLGTYDQIVHGHDPKVELGIGLHLANVTRTHWSGPNPGLPIPTLAKGELDYEATFGYATGSLHVRHLRFGHEGLTITVSRSAKGAYRLSGPGYAAHHGPDGKPTPKREYKPEKSLMLSDPARQALNAFGTGTDDLSLALSQAVGQIQYLGPLRERPQPMYLWGGQEPGEIGSRGEDAVPALLANLNAAKRADRGVMVSEVSRWLKEMGVADGLSIKQVGSSRFYEVMVIMGGKETNLVHVGFGVSQVLPMIVLAIMAPEGTTIIAEQPEIHLHPKAQTSLANLMVETAKRRKLQFLVETHSEHLFRRLQFLIADRHHDVSRDDCRLYFVNRQEGGDPALERLDLDTYGRIGNWPDEFFGDAIGEVERQTTRMIERRREERARG